MEKTPENMEKLWGVCKKFIKDNKIHCEETIGQCDWVIENAYDLISDISTIVGFLEEEE